MQAMNDWKKAVLLAGICSGTLFMGVLPAQAADKQVSAGSQQQQGIQSVSVITKVYGDGEKPAYAVLKYPQPVAPGISPAAFKVAGQTVAAVSVNRTPEPACNPDGTNRSRKTSDAAHFIDANALTGLVTCVTFTHMTSCNPLLHLEDAIGEISRKMPGSPRTEIMLTRLH